MKKFLNAFCKKYDTFLSDKTVENVKQFTIIIALLAFILNLAFIFLNNTLGFENSIIARAGTNYFSAIFTPFSIILFYEVFLLVIAIPNSITRSLAKQYEVLSLIIVLRVFKDVSELQNFTDINSNAEVLRNILLDMGASFLLFSLITIFYFTLRQRAKSRKIPNDDRKALFIKIKKLVTVFLSIVVTGVFINFSFIWIDNLIDNNEEGFFAIQERFFEALFTILIFIDILVVLLSYAFTKDFAVIFRNASFIISIILIRFAITADRPYDLLLAVVALCFGILINYVYNQFTSTRYEFLVHNGHSKNIEADK